MGLSASTPSTTTVRLGIDWGTSNRRAYVLDDHGEVLREHIDHAGILQVADFPQALRGLLQAMQIETADVVMSGMVGSRNGWREVQYISTDSPLLSLPAALCEIASDIPGVRVRIAPGICYLDARGVPDVMRGEETQVLGALALGAPEDGWFLLPGTHSKWVQLKHGKVCDLLTFMTGELYALLSEHGTLAQLMQEKPAVQEAFASGLQAARHGSFTHAAFGCRALVVTDRMPASHAASYLSGLLIGCELGDILRRAGSYIDAPVQVIGSPALAARYQSALELLGLPCRAWEPDKVYCAALGAFFGIDKS